MVELAVKDNPHFEASRIEADQTCKTYAGDTTRRYKAQLGNTAEVFFITGLDALLTIMNWDDSRTYPGICHFVAATRPGCDPEKIKTRFRPFFYPTQPYWKNRSYISHQPKSGHGLKSGGPSRGWCLKQCGSIFAVITSIVIEYGNRILRSIPDVTWAEKVGERANLKRKEGRVWN